MKGYVVLAAAILAILDSVHALPTLYDEPVDKRWPIPQVDGSVQWMTRGEAIIEALLTEPNAAISPNRLDKVRFFLYTQANPTVPDELDMEDPESLARSSFNPNNPTRFVVHGWNGGWQGGENTQIRGALLLNGENRQYNFIAVDWSIYGESLNYVTSQMSCSKAGKILAEFIDWLYDNANLKFETLALYGHSLGSHVVGFAGKNVKRGRVHTIVGLDPAMPLFSYSNAATRLSETDAEYVETIQTNGGTLGFYKPIGLASFYPNGGSSQPGCGIDIGGGCAHGRSVTYLAEALTSYEANGFHAVGCIDSSKISEDKCNTNANGVRMGDPTNAGRASGIYYLNTNSGSPFGMGNVYAN